MAMAMSQVHRVYTAVPAALVSSSGESAPLESASFAVALPRFSSWRSLSQSISDSVHELSVRRRIGSKRRSIQCRASKGPSEDYRVLSPEMKDALDKFIAANKVVLFMKGNRNFPQCGFSNTCVQILNQCEVPYETVNILEDESLRQGVKEYSKWPTFPQLYIDGEFFGGCDITLEAFESGELKETLVKAMLS